MSILELDGSQGEGSGQTLRTALSLSAILQKPFSINNIRANRPKPGLQAQHLTSVNACAELCGAQVEGNHLNSSELSFSPGAIRSGNFSFSVGTAGSTTLVLQTLLPVALFSPGECTFSVEGGTENPFAPTSFYFTRVFLPMVSKMGVHARVRAERFGWYPKGGGKIVASVQPAKKITGLKVAKRGKLENLKGFSLTSNLPSHVRERMKSRALVQLSENSLTAKVESLNLPSVATGAEFFLLAEFENVLAGFFALGELNKPAEKVAGESLHSFLEFQKGSSVVESHLADQLLLYCALARGQSSFSVEKITGHLLTNAQVIGKFLPECKIVLEGQLEKHGKVLVEGKELE